MSDGYKKRVAYTFEAGGEVWEVEAWNDDWMWIIETRNNGQEDCHTSFELERVNGVWELGEGARERILENWWNHTPDSVLEFVKEHGIPE